MVLENNWISTSRKMKLVLCLSPWTENHIKWVKALYLTFEILKRLEEDGGVLGGIQHALQDSGVPRSFLNRTAPAINRWGDSLQRRLSMHRKGSYKRSKEPVGWRTSSPAVRQTRGLYPEFTKNCKSCTQRKYNCQWINVLTAVTFFKRRNTDDQ